MKARDAVELGKLAVQIATGRYVSATVTTIKNRKLIMGIISTILVILMVLIAIIVSMPGLLMQSMLPPDQKEVKYKDLTTFAYQEIDEVEIEKKNSIAEFLSSLVGDADSEDGSSIKFIGAEPNKEEVLMLYSVKYEGYFDGAKVDKSKIKELTKSFLEVDGLEVKVKPFEQVVNECGLTDVQKAIALNMYNNYMYGQTVVSGGHVNDAGVKNYGSITYKNGQTNVVYFNQRDQRWSDLAYGRTGTIGATACGPTSLAMAVSSLTSRTIDPVEMSNWAYKNGYKCEGGGSYWTLIPEGAKHFGLKVEGNVTEAQQIVDALSSGKLIIAIMGQGHFTTSGHFLLLRGITEQGKILVADSYSSNYTKKEWDMQIILNEVKKGNTAGGPFWILSK